MNDDTSFAVVVEFVENPLQSVCVVSAKCDLPTTSVHRVMKAKKFHPYKSSKQHEITGEDPEKRLCFCEKVGELMTVDPNFLRHVCFTDESTFTLKGYDNNQNYRHWATTNSRDVTVTHSV